MLVKNVQNFFFSLVEGVLHVTFRVSPDCVTNIALLSSLLACNFYFISSRTHNWNRQNDERIVSDIKDFYAQQKPTKVLFLSAVCTKCNSVKSET